MPLRFTMLAVLVSCTPRAHDVASTFALVPDIPVGTLAVQLAAPSGALSVTVNDQLVVERKHTRNATIGAVPAGIARVRVTYGGGCETGAVIDRDVEIRPGITATVALPGPELSTGCATASGLYYIGAQIGVAASAVALFAVGALAMR